MNNSEALLNTGGGGLAIDGVAKSYRIGAETIQVLRGLDLQVNPGEWVALLGASGSGKTTLMNIVGALERPDTGTVSLAGEDYARMSARRQVAFRRDSVGFVFQSYHLLPELDVVDNAALPAMLAGFGRPAARCRSREILEQVGLGHRLRHRPYELSGGERQRAAIARALVNSPSLILADEPTGNLDAATGAGILEVFQDIHRQRRQTIILMVTHDPQIAALAGRRVELADGAVKT